MLGRQARSSHGRLIVGAVGVALSRPTELLSVAWRVGVDVLCLQAVT